MEAQDLTDHIHLLTGLCRFCCKRVTSKDAYNKINFKEEVEIIYNVNVVSEPFEVYPKFICRNCSRDLYRYRSLAKQCETDPSQFKKELYNFLPHSSEDCDTCNRGKAKPLNPKKRKKEHFPVLNETSDDSSAVPAPTHDDESFSIEQLKTLIRLVSNMKVEDKLDTYMEMINEMPSDDVDILSYCLGKKVQQEIANDAASFALQYKDPKSMSTFNVCKWLEARNSGIIAYLKGIGNLRFDISFDMFEENQKVLTIALGVEQLYLIRCKNLISPISFLLNICIYSVTGSKVAADMLGNSCAAGHYKTVTNWLREQGTKEPVTPPGDLMNVFDNEQIIGRKSTIRPNQKVTTSIITNKGVVSLESDIMLQCDPGLKPNMPNHLQTVIADSNPGSSQVEGQSLHSLVKEILSQSSDRFLMMEKSHFEQLYYFIDSAIGVVYKEQEKEGHSITDSIDRKVVKDKQDEVMIKCLNCGTMNRKRKQICGGCNEREGLKTAKELKKKSSDTVESEKPTSYTKLAFVKGKDSTEVKVENNVYDHIPSNHKKSHEVLLTDPVFCNPNSYESVALVLRKIGKDLGIFKYGGSLRHWTFICCEGLPYVICKKLQEEAVVCTENNCNEKFLSKDKFLTHARQKHPDKEYCDCVKEFDWFYLRIGAGHYEMNLVKAFFELNWIPFLEALCERMGFISEAAKQYAKACKDLHKSWNLLVVFHTASLRELVLPYVRHCIQTGQPPDGKQFFEYNNGEYQSISRPNFKYMMDQVCRFSQGIINFRMAVRRNNSELLKSSKYMTKELFHGRQHPKYREIEVNDSIQDMLMPESVRKLNDSYSSITTSGNESTGQDFDFILEEKNRQLKSWIPKGIPTDAIWQTVCRNNLILEEIKENAMYFFGIYSEKGISKSPNLEDAVHSFRCLLRGSDYLNKSDDHTSISNVALDDQLVNFIENATVKRTNFIKTAVLCEEIDASADLRNPLPITMEEREKLSSIENMTVPQIKCEIERLLDLIPEGIQYDYHQHVYHSEIKTKKKETLINFLQELKDSLCSDVHSTQENASDITDMITENSLVRVKSGHVLEICAVLDSHCGDDDCFCFIECMSAFNS